MPVFLQPVEVSERCFLGEVLFWLAFQRLPVAFYDHKGRDIRDTTKAGGYETELPDRLITDEEAKRAGLSPDPRYRAVMEERPGLLPSFYDDLLKRYDPEPEDRARLLEERAAAEIYQSECNSWEPHYQRAIEYSGSRIFVALRGGQIVSTGRLLPGRTLEEACEAMERDDKNVFDFPLAAVPPSFWSLSGIDFEAGAAGNGSSYYCHLACSTADVLAVFPGERESIVVERIGDSVIISDAERKLPLHGRRGRPSYPWEPFHVEVAALLQRGELPTKKESAIQHFQTWFETTLGVEPSRAAIGERLKPYYDKFGRRGGQKIAG